MKICPQCQTENKDIAKWCRKCALVFADKIIDLELSKILELTKIVEEIPPIIETPIQQSNLRPCIDCEQIVSIHAQSCVHCGCYFQTIEVKKVNPAIHVLSVIVALAWAGVIMGVGVAVIVLLSGFATSDNVMQQSVICALALAIAILPYCIARALSEIAKLVS